MLNAWLATHFFVRRVRSHALCGAAATAYTLFCNKTALRRFAIHLWEIVTNIYLKALNSNCLSHKNNVGMYLTQCERTAIPFEMINKFYYYLSSLKVAASTL